MQSQRETRIQRRGRDLGGYKRGESFRLGRVNGSAFEEGECYKETLGLTMRRLSLPTSGISPKAFSLRYCIMAGTGGPFGLIQPWDV
jgi:hypothetical protein